MFSKVQQAFIALVRAGLWEDVMVNGEGVTVNGSPFSISYGVDWNKVLDLAEEQSVVGLLAAGIERFKVQDLRFKIPMPIALQFIGRTVQLEQRSQAMNYFIGLLVEKMREEGIFTLLVKGQGVAQCYERPLWRPSGDVDFLLDAENYKKAKAYLLPLSSGNKNEERYSQHLGISIDPWYVEIHGTLRSGLSASVDRTIDAVQAEVFREGKVRTWKNDATEVFLPAPDHDVFLVFTHFIKHLYKEGVSLRQVCDWCRLLWTFRPELDVALQERWLRQAGLMDEWQAFAALAVEYLGMPAEAMPMFNDNHNEKLRKKAELLLSFILAGGGQHKVRDTFALAKIFPRNTVKFLPSIFLNVNWLKVRERVMGK